MTMYEFSYNLTKELSKADRKALEKDANDNWQAGEYLICDDTTADDQTQDSISELLWAFKPEFLASCTGLPIVIFEKLAELSEDSQSAIRALVDVTCGLPHLIKEAVSSDGRGHFLSSYDGNELEYRTKSGRIVYIYRTN